MAYVVVVSHPKDRLEYSPLHYPCVNEREAIRLVKSLVTTEAKGLEFPVTSPNGEVTISEVYDTNLR